MGTAADEREEEIGLIQCGREKLIVERLRVSCLCEIDGQSVACGLPYLSMFTGSRLKAKLIDNRHHTPRHVCPSHATPRLSVDTVPPPGKKLNLAQNRRR